MIKNSYLLASQDDGEEFVQEYTENEMAEIFTLGERLDLDSGKAVVKTHRTSAIRYVDMIAAARQITN